MARPHRPNPCISSFNPLNLTEMKKILSALTVAAIALLFPSCDEGFREENGSAAMILDPNTLVFNMKKSVPETRAVTGCCTDARGVTIPLDSPIEGYALFLEESITISGEAFGAPETKGTPIYTENFIEMSGGKFYGLAFPVSEGALSTAPAIPDGPFINDEDVWIRKFPSDPFGGDDVLYFFMRAQENVEGMSGLRYSMSDGGGVIEFDYTVPLDAADQQDILFASRPVTKEEAKTEIPILFHHALTGIKFATDNDNSSDVSTYITKVEFPEALFRSGHIRIVSTSENGLWMDDPDTHSSSQPTVNDVSGGVVLGCGETFTLTLDDGDIVDFETGGSFANKGRYADSFAAAGNRKNLNDADASRTFWLIPQQMNDDVVMDVTFHVVSGGKDSGPVTRRIELGKALTGNVFWKAGEIRTYTLKADLMDVDIEDKVSGFEKTDVVITNTGNLDSFIRAHIVANWYGNAGDDYGLAVGYRSSTDEEFVPAWRMNASMTGDNFGGVFTGLPGNNWIYNGNDGFFYYRNVVPAGQSIPDPLFIKYAMDTTPAGVPPEVYYLDRKGGKLPYTDLELVMEIPVQAIEAEEGRTSRQAWEALGVSFN